MSLPHGMCSLMSYQAHLAQLHVPLCVTRLKAVQSCLETSLNFEVLNDFTVAPWAFCTVRGSICTLSAHRVRMFNPCFPSAFGLRLFFSLKKAFLVFIPVPNCWSWVCDTQSPQGGQCMQGAWAAAAFAEGSPGPVLLLQAIVPTAAILRCVRVTPQPWLVLLTPCQASSALLQWCQLLLLRAACAGRPSTAGSCSSSTAMG